MKIVYPDYICVVEKVTEGWKVKTPSKIFWRSPDCQIPHERESRAQTYGLTDKKIIIELFRKYLGKMGFYLVNMRDRSYYYCGLTWEDVQQKLWDIGITQPGGK